MEKCMICAKELANLGAVVSHMRVHVRRGEATEFKHPATGKACFKAINVKPKDEPEKKTPFAMLGQDPIDGQPKKVWEIPIDQYKVIDPKQYFITTGEAIVKIDQMISDISDLGKEMRKLKRKLIKAKGESKYLETAWELQRLIIKRKDPRRKSLK